MKIAYLTAGAGGMYCGSCMRDNTLVAALRRQKRDVMLIPVYSPIRVDEDDVSENTVYYGGINVYLQQKSAVFRHTPKVVDRLLNSPGLLRRAMKMSGSASQDDLAKLTISILSGDDGAQRKELDKLVEGLRPHSFDLVHLPNALFVGLAKGLRERLGVRVVCTLTGEDIFIDKLPDAPRKRVVELIRQRATDVDAFIAVTRYYAGYAVEHFGIPKDRMHHVPLGVRVDYESDSEKMSFMSGSDVFTIGYFARVCPEKGLHVLCEAFALLRKSGRDCRLKIGGYCGESDRAYFDDVKHRMSGLKLEDAIEYDGELDRAEKLRFLRSLDVLSVPTVYREAKGLYVLEALAQGVAVVQPRHGSFPELVEATGGGVLVNPQDPADLARALAAMMDDLPACHRMGEAGQDVVAKSFTDSVMADAAWGVFEGAVAARKGGAPAVR